MPENDIRTLVSVEADKSGVDAARAALKQVTKEQDKLVDSFARGEIDAKAYNKQLRELETNEKSLKRAIDSVTGEFSEQARAMREAADATAELAREQAELSTVQGRFDKVSQDVALAGDVESGVRTIGGAIGAFGGAGIESVLSKGGELFAVVEALPKLKSAAAGLPNVIDAAAAAMGTSRTGFIGGMAAVGIALAAVTIAVRDFVKKMQDQADELSARLGSRLGVEKFIAGGGSVTEAQSRIAALNAEREAELNELAQLQREYAIFEERAGALVGVMKALAPQEQVLADAIQNLKTSTAGSQTEIMLLERAISEGRLATEAATSEEKALAAARQESTAASESAAQAEKKVQFRVVQSSLSISDFFNLSLAGGNVKDIEEGRKAAQDAADERLEIEHQFAQDEMALRQDLADQRFELQLDEFRDTQDSIRDFQRSRSDALQEGNFLALREINQSERETAEDRRLQVRRGNEDINREGERSRRELQQQSINSMQELNAVVNAGLNGVINQFSSAFGAINQSQPSQSSGGILPAFPRSD